MTTCEDSNESSADNHYSMVLKKYIDANRIPPIYQCLEWKMYELQNMFNNNQCFHALPNFLFTKFYSFQLLEKKKVESTSHLRIKTKSDSDNEQTNTLDLTGCPLECPFEFTNFEEALQSQEPDVSSWTVCQAEHARLILNLYLSEMYKCFHFGLPLLIPCDGLDPQHTVLLAAFKECNAVTHIQGIKLPGTFSTMNVPSMSIFKKEISAIFPRNRIMPEIKAEAVYQILESNSSSPSSLILTCQWENPLAMLEPPNLTSLCTLDMHISPGDLKSPISSLFKELSFLDRTIRSLKDQEMIWHIDNSEDPVSMNERLHRLIELTKDVRRYHKNQGELIDGDGGGDLGIYIEDILIKKRQNLDFTDHLWNTLIKSSSYSELKEGLSYVADAISKGEVIPVVLRSNQTSLGRWIRNKLRGQESSLLLDGLEPMKHLAEIGVRKIQEEYCSLFIGLELATQDLLAPFFKTWQDKDAVSCLYLLHTTLELVLICKVFLAIPKHVLGGFARKILSEGKCTENYSYKFQVPVMAVYNKLESLICSEWQVCGTLSSTGLTMKKSLHFAKKLLPHLQDSSTKLCPGISQSNIYHGTQYTYMKHHL